MWVPGPSAARGGLPLRVGSVDPMQGPAGPPVMSIDHPAELVEERQDAALQPARRSTLTLLSFGFKYGRPPANHYFDVSFLKNPAREAGWDLFSERSPAMRRFVLEQPEARAFLDAALPVLRLLARVDDDARVALGCSAGRHRSAIVAEELARRLAAEGRSVRVVHREEDPAR